jgi:acyl CoA:acetate/3-ketoacid CoA transferase beta subunit
MFDIVWSGKRHVIMSGSQIDAFGNHNFAAIGSEWRVPRVQLLGFRGAPGNTIQNATSYFIPNHSRQVFVERVDVVTGVGWDRAAALDKAGRFYGLRRVVTNLCVMDFGGTSHRMRLLSVHPGVSVDDVVAATGFELAVADSLGASRLPDANDLFLIRHVIDPSALREQEVPDPE